MALTDTRHTGRIPSRVSQKLRVDPIAAELDNAVYRAVFETLAEALSWIDEANVTRDPGTGSNAWTVELSPGVHDFPAGLVAADGVMITGHESAGRYAQGADVILRCDATAGDLLSLGVGGKLRNVRLEVRGADGSLGHTLTGPISAVVIADAYVDKPNLLENVTIIAEVNGAGNDAHPIILVDHRNTRDTAIFRMSRCELSQRHAGLTPNAGSRLMKALAFGYGGQRDSVIDSCLFYNQPSGTPRLAVAIEWAGGVRVVFRDCDFKSVGIGTSKALQHSGGNPISIFRNCTSPGNVDPVVGSILWDDLGAAPYDPTEAGLKYQLAYELVGTDLFFFVHDGTEWKKATAGIPVATWIPA